MDLEIIIDNSIDTDYFVIDLITVKKILEMLKVEERNVIEYIIRSEKHLYNSIDLI